MLSKLILELTAIWIQRESGFSHSLWKIDQMHKRDLGKLNYKILTKQ